MSKTFRKTSGLLNKKSGCDLGMIVKQGNDSYRTWTQRF
jgi:hypothetical protein